MSAVITGGCLCKNVRFAYTGTLGAAAYCHRSDCRKCTGSAFNVSVGVERAHFEITVGLPKDFVKKGDSGNEHTRHFCPDCGSPLFTSSPRHPDRLYLKAGAFDDPTLIQPTYQSWTRSSVSWATIKAGLCSYETGRGCRAGA
jgi:hypothetical protein